MNKSKDRTFPPGLYFLLRTLPVLTVPPLVVHVVLASILPSSPSSIAFRVLLYCSSVPFCGIAYHKWRSICDALEARRLGIVQVPVVRGKLPGNFDVVTRLEKEEKDGYCGTGAERFIREHGKTVALEVLWSTTKVLTTEPEHIKSVLATDFPTFVKGPTFIAAMESMLGQGIFNSDGDMWKFHRAITRPFFTRDRISDFDTFDRHADSIIEKMKARFDAGTAVDFQDVVSRFTLDSAADFLFGVSMDSIGATPLPLPVTEAPNSVSANSKKDFAKAFADAQMHVSFRHRIGPLWPLLEFFGDKTADDMKVCYELLDPIVEKALKEKGAKTGIDVAVDATEEGTLLAHLVQQTDGRSPPLAFSRTALQTHINLIDAAIIRSELLNILIAGRDTTAATLTFATYALAMYPDVLGKLRQEILDTVGPQRRPTFDDVRQMKYLRAVINETLRLFPPVPFDAREAAKQTTLSTPNGPTYYIAAGTTIIYSVLLMHRDPDLWGPDSFEFDPERWLDSRVQQYLTQNPFIFLPFNAGPRICLGQQFAYNEVSFFLIRLLQKFDRINLAPEAQPPASLPPPSWANGSGRRPVERVCPKTHLTLYAEGGLWLKMDSASATEDAAS
ncbi:hypothetical protein BOTBODRAFT_636486 [Botryobasidium botryosum FD-172 SS1]|uniref:Cytochrome P450 n=1 Tax=Botryobasidium botryosum (strain FD-172 SS1) TaxID=930990 RepID=A0A067N6Z5_BOTB1|nr:hypothetical protein BOTBODRAFT_636486 [Botryobasidium botryosum FD-172 SS1]